MQHFEDGGVDLEPARKCLQEKCKGAAPALQRLDDASMTTGSVLGSTAATKAQGPLGVVLLPRGALTGFLALLALGGLFATLSLGRRPEPTAAQSEALAAQESGEASQAAVE